MRRPSSPGESDPHILGTRLRQLREALGLVLQDIANLFGTNRNVPSQWEGGQRAPSYEHLLTLADFYGVTTDWLLGRDGADRDSPRVRRLKSQLGDYLRMKEGTLQGTTPGERLRLALTFLESQASDLFHTERMARQLLLSPETLRHMLFGQAMATGVVVQRFAQFANLPELWFYQPIPQLEDPLVKYRPLVERFLAEGMEPEEVEQRLWGAKRGGSKRSRR